MSELNKSDSKQMEVARDLILGVIQKHERSEHQTAGVCMTERINAVAFIAHSLRVTPLHLFQVNDRLAEYERMHNENRS